LPAAGSVQDLAAVRLTIKFSSGGRSLD